ncbi:MAG: hypothetical protein M9898_10415 [Chitinophagaceae bacterium]|nr:hypothetical protein [Chitinophagaceae bacterium]
MTQRLNQLKSKQPQLFPTEKKHIDYRKKRKETELKAISEMLNRPYSFQEAVENLNRLKRQRNEAT